MNKTQQYTIYIESEDRTLRFDTAEQRDRALQALRFAQWMSLPWSKNQKG